MQANNVGELNSNDLRPKKKKNKRNWFFVCWGHPYKPFCYWLKINKVKKHFMAMLALTETSLYWLINDHTRVLQSNPAITREQETWKWEGHRKRWMILFSLWLTIPDFVSVAWNFSLANLTYLGWLPSRSKSAYKHLSRDQENMVLWHVHGPRKMQQCSMHHL